METFLFFLACSSLMTRTGTGKVLFLSPDKYKPGVLQFFVDRYQKPEVKNFEILLDTQRSKSESANP